MFLNVCKQIFHITHMRISQKVKGVLMWNLQHAIFIWRGRYSQIFKSALVPGRYGRTCLPLHLQSYRPQKWMKVQEMGNPKPKTKILKIEAENWIHTGVTSGKGIIPYHIVKKQFTVFRTFLFHFKNGLSKICKRESLKI